MLSVFVVQLGYATASQVMGAAAEWAAARREGRTFAEVLTARGLLDADKRRMVEGLVGRALQLNEMDVGRTLQSLSAGLNTLMRSISTSMVSDHTTAPTKETPQADSLEGSENVCDEPVGRYDFDTDGYGNPHELGRGGIGRVVVVHDRYLGRDVALKELLSEHTSNPQFATTRMVALEQRFLREARLTGQLEHPAIVPVFELGRRLDGGLYYTMQRVRGRTLHELIKQARSLENRLKLMNAYLTTCQAIAYAHSRAVVHRDIKPQNVMVGPFGETYVLDWGLARVKGRSDPRAADLKLQPDITGNVLEGGAIGTPSYMSPEQAEGKVDLIDERSDVWCLGAVLYEVLTGEPPYTGKNPFDVLTRIMKEDVLPVRAKVEDAPVELVAIAEKALTRDRARRYPSAAEMAKDISSWLEGGRVGAHAYTGLDLFGRFTRRNRVPLTVASVAAAVLVGFGVLAYRQVRHERDEARAFAQLFLDDVSDKLEPIAGSGPLVEQLTTKTLEYYKSTVDPKTGDRTERMRLCRAWKKIARLALEVDKNGEAESAYAFALEVARPLVDEQPKDPDARVLLSESLIGLGDVELDRGDVAKSEARVLEAIGHAQAAVEAWPRHVEALDSLSRGNSRLAALRLTAGRVAEALAPAQTSLEVDQRLAKLVPDSEQMQVNVLVSMDKLATVLARNQRLDEALKMSETAVAQAEKAIEKSPKSLEGLRSAAYLNITRAELARQQGDGERAKRAIEAAYQHGMRLLQAEPHDSQGRQAVALAEVQTGRAEAAYRRFLAMGDAAYEADSFDIFALSMFFTERWDEVIALVRHAPPTNKKLSCTLAALASARRGDAPRAAALALDAARAGPTLTSWLVDLVSQRLEHSESALQSRAWQLARQLDVAERKGDPEATDLALQQFAHDVAP
ncbi:MAG: protein kinase [Archangiaceae bacterium]|nr:protein kinase [Archangiaceae bacterium]